MNAITDLSSEAVSYLTLIQDILKDKLKTKSEPARWLSYWKIEIVDGGCEQETVRFPLEACDGFKGRIGELVWSSKGGEATGEMVSWFFNVTAALLGWLENYMSKKNSGEQEFLLEQTPNFWRESIRYILYHEQDSRKGLVEALHYMPLQVVQALAEPKVSIYRQRLYQVYLITDIESSPIFTTNDLSILHDWWDMKRIEAIVLLNNDETLRIKLLEAKQPLPFESLFHQELDQIIAARQIRNGDAGDDNSNDNGTEAFDSLPPPVNNPPVPPDAANKPSNGDPMERASTLQLSGLAFSGGGIRSATFSLGIMQKLAKVGLLSHFDYLSTVSGGGYIGSWYCSWIRALGSIKKVTERLNPNTSPEPRAEEVRPIRWLRMFSNYLAPDASGMSIDVWTIVITWVRNTLVNQSVLLLLLLFVLSAIDLLFNSWCFAQQGYPGQHYSLWPGSVIAFGIGGTMAASGMRAYDRHSPPQSKTNRAGAGLLVPCLVIWCIIGAIVTSTWFFWQPPTAFVNMFVILMPCGISSSVCMMGVAYLGNYYKKPEEEIPVTADKSKKIDIICWNRVFYIILSSIAAGLILELMLTIGWKLIFLLQHCGTSWIHQYFGNSFEPKLVIICGLPLLLESVSIAVVTRMAILGRLFPDERREWWGRLGAIIHRFAVIWIVVSSSALLLPTFVLYVLPHLAIKPYLTLIFGSWSAVVAAAVKFAFSSSSGGDKTGKSSKVKEILVALAPYLFIFGFLLIGAWVLNYVRLLERMIPWFSDEILVADLEMTGLLLALTFFLGYRVGVNEFSLHHFYRNRLVRGYLGAVRRRTDRENTANSFTGFDKKDDYPLGHLLAGGADGYTGPYLLLNGTLNATTVTELDRQDRKGESWLFSPLYCGFDFSPVRSAAYTRDQIYDYGYRPTLDFSAIGGPTLGTAVATSGAAVNPNMGYHSSAPIGFLLTMFNIRLGWWFGNPVRSTWKRSDPLMGLSYLVKDLVAKSDVSSKYISVSDGGHFDNMGLYELVRRRCTYILVCDGEGDPDVICEGLAMAIRRCYIDFGATIKLDITDIVTKNKDTSYSLKHLAEGTITYAGHAQPTGRIVYIKTTLTANTAPDIREYAKSNPEFPQQSTVDQFFDEAQFESYRKLGYSSFDELSELAVDKNQLSDIIPTVPLLAFNRSQPLVLTLTASLDKPSNEILQVTVKDMSGLIKYDKTHDTNFNEAIPLAPGQYFMEVKGNSTGLFKLNIAGFNGINPQPGAYSAGQFHHFFMVLI